MRARLIELGTARRWFVRRFWPGAPSATVLWMFAAAIVIALFLIPDLGIWHLWGAGDTFCKRHEFGCDLSIHVGGTALVAAIAYFLVFLQREARAARKWRSQARRAPETLFTSLPPLDGLTGEATSTAAVFGRRRQHGSPILRWIRRHTRHNELVGSVISRQQLVAGLADDLDEAPEPRVLVAPSGSGKTMVLLKLAHDLRGQVCVPVALRGERQVDFERLGRAMYRRHARAHSEEADKQWEWLRKRGRITILADELEKCRDRPAQRVQALEAAARDGLRVVVTCRPDGIPATYRRGRIDLEALDRDEVVDDLARRNAEAPEGKPRLDRKQITAIVEQADICSTPYYLALARVLASLGRLRNPGRGESARLLLLQGYRTVVANGTVRPDVGLPAETRTDDLRALEIIAFVRLLGARTEKRIGREIGQLGWDVNVRDVVERTQRLGVLVNRYDGQVRFGHPTALAYFASCFLTEHRNDQRLWDMVFRQAEITPLLALTLTLANAASRDHKLTEGTVCTLLGRVGSANGRNGRLPEPGGGELASAMPSPNGDAAALNQRLALVATAAEVAVWDPKHDRGLRSRIVTSAKVTQLRGEEVAATRRRLVQAIQGLDTAEGFEKLWSYASEKGDYRFRRQAAKALIAGGISALPVITPRIREAIRSGERKLHRNGGPLERVPDRLSNRLGAAAWILPSFRTVADQQNRPELELLNKLQGRLIVLSRDLTGQRGLEASVAQGLKLDAVQQPSHDFDGLAEAMLVRDAETTAQFWFSRVLALQAITRRGIEATDPSRRKTARQVILDAYDDKHPFVRETATLCLQAINRSNWYRYQWDDIMETGEHTPHGLTIEASQLVGDMLLALNLNENGEDEAKLDFGYSNSLPACLSKSEDRLEILGSEQPPKSCPAGKATGRCFCPYLYEFPTNGKVRRELSRAFCRHQRLTARRLPWQTHMSVQSLKDFWAAMEDLAQF